MNRLRNIISSANNFYDAAERCDWPKGEVNHSNRPLMIPEFVNRAFACELYLKGIAAATDIKIINKHQLDYLFNHLKEEDKNKIFYIWLDKAGENLFDCEYTRKKFSDNLLSISDVFERFRYTHEWVGSVLSVSSSFKRPEQIELLSQGNMYGGFLKTFAQILRKHIFSEYLSEFHSQVW
ncbi:MAG: hypothetical protein RBR50_00740 [Candidatus Izemoplasmatales bacterium]|nr:hypothetical protein [Candidatus Izemoplasmatales bacterium]